MGSGLLIIAVVVLVFVGSICGLIAVSRVRTLKAEFLQLKTQLSRQATRLQKLESRLRGEGVQPLAPPSAGAPAKEPSRSPASSREDRPSTVPLFADDPNEVDEARLPTGAGAPGPSELEADVEEPAMPDTPEEREEKPVAARETARPPIERPAFIEKGRAAARAGLERVAQASGSSIEADGGESLSTIARNLFDEHILEKLKQIGPKDPNMSWEQALGTYWLPRGGAVAVAIGVVFFLSYTVGRWDPIYHILAGYGACAIFLVLAKRIEKKYPAFARVLWGGGFALLYFVTFATYYVPIVRIFSTPLFTLLGLAAIVAGWAMVAQRRRSPSIALSVTALGHFTVGLSTFSVVEPAPFTAAGLIMLSVGSLFFLIKNQWYYVAAAGLVGTYLNHFLLLSNSSSSGDPIEFALGMVILSIYLLIFVLAELYAPENLRRKKVPVWFRSAFVTFNTACFFGLGTQLVGSYYSEYQYAFRYLLGAGLICVAFLYLKRRGKDPLFNMYMTKGVAVVTLGLESQFDGLALTDSLAIEVIVLMFESRRSGYVVTRVHAHVIAVLALLHGLYTAIEYGYLPYGSPDYAVFAILSATTVLAFYAASLLYQRTDWTLRSPQSVPVKDDLLRVLWMADFIVEPPRGLADSKKPLGGLLFPYAFAGVATLLFYAYALVLVAAPDRAAIAAAFAVILGGTAIGLRSAPYGRTVVLLFGGAFIFSGLTWTQYAGLPTFSFESAKAAAVLLSFFAFSEVSRRVSGLNNPERAGVFPDGGFLQLGEPITAATFVKEPPESNRDPLLGYAAALPGAFLFLGFCLSYVQAGSRAVTVAAGALVFAVLARALGALPFGFVSLLITTAALVLGTMESARALSTSTMSIPVAVACLAALMGTALFSERRYLGAGRSLSLHQCPPAPYWLYGIVAWIPIVFLPNRFDPPVHAPALGGAAVIAALLTNVLHARALAFSSVALLLAAQGLWHFDAGPSTVLWRHAIPLVLTVLAFSADRYYFFKKVPFVRPVLVTAAWLMLMHYVEIQAPDEWLSFLWCWVTAGFFLYGFGFQSRTASTVAVLGTLWASLFHLGNAYPGPVALLPLAAGFVAPAALWFTCERRYLRAASKLKLPEIPHMSKVFLGLGSLMSLLLVERALTEYFLTIGWAVLAVLFFGMAWAFREKWYRYAGLVLLLLAVLRVALIDTRVLSAGPRAAAWGVLGVILIAVGFGYVKAFGEEFSAAGSVLEEEPPPEPVEPH